MVALRVRLPQLLTVAIGPPKDPRDDEEMVSALMARPGKKAVCGGTTAGIVARILGRELTVDLEHLSDEVPPMGKIQGLDLVTEGIITVSRSLWYLRRGNLSEGGKGAKAMALINSANCSWKLMIYVFSLVEQLMKHTRILACPRSWL